MSSLKFDFELCIFSYPRTYSLICLLMDHGEDLTDGQRKRYKRISDLIRLHWKFAKDFTEREVFKVLGILSVNSFCVHDGLEDGTGLIGKKNLDVLKDYLLFSFATEYIFFFLELDSSFVGNTLFTQLLLTYKK